MVKQPDPIHMLQDGMRVAAFRQSTIANNIANLDTPGYRRADVRFEQLLSNAIDKGQHLDPTQLQKAIFQPQDSAVDLKGNDVNMDSEVGEMMKNDSSYKMYVRLTSKLYQQMASAMQVE